MKKFIVLGSLNGFLAVVIGAFGAHGLENVLSDKMKAVYTTGVQYHMYHALALLVVAVLCDRLGESREMVWSGWLFVIGIVLFSGSLYALSISRITLLGIITPFGGIAFLAGWALLAIAAWKQRH
jgi:uncharacterized membrane protein YgdD (TMEM256/DUF423 family)